MNSNKNKLYMKITTLEFLDKKLFNYKVVDSVEDYNFDIKFVFI